MHLILFRIGIHCKAKKKKKKWYSGCSLPLSYQQDILQYFSTLSYKQPLTNRWHPVRSNNRKTSLNKYVFSVDFTIPTNMAS